MWPFRSSRTYQLPPWSFISIGTGLSSLALRIGKWVITDGLVIDDSNVSLGEVILDEATVQCVLGDDGLSTVILTYSGESSRKGTASESRTSEIVIDSGQLVICNVVAFSGICNSRESSYSFLSHVNREYSRERIVAVLDDESAVVGIVINPPFGDGCYAIALGSSINGCCVTISVDRSN